MEFKKYKRVSVAEARPVTEHDIRCFKQDGDIMINGDLSVSISDADFNNGSPKIGDMIARNPQNYQDQWLIAKKYFKDNFEEV